eukprot:4995355-Amphidinium_carterae.1
MALWGNGQHECQRKRVLLNRDQIWSLVVDSVQEDLVTAGIEMDDPTDEWLDNCLNLIDEYTNCHNVLAEMRQFSALAEEGEEVMLVAGSGLYRVTSDFAFDQSMADSCSSGKRIVIGTEGGVPKVGWPVVERPHGRRPTEKALWQDLPLTRFLTHTGTEGTPNTPNAIGSSDAMRPNFGAGIYGLLYESL